MLTITTNNAITNLLLVNSVLCYFWLFFSHAAFCCRASFFSFAITHLPFASFHQQYAIAYWFFVVTSKAHNCTSYAACWHLCALLEAACTIAWVSMTSLCSCRQCFFSFYFRSTAVADFRCAAFLKSPVRKSGLALLFKGVKWLARTLRRLMLLASDEHWRALEHSPASECSRQACVCTQCLGMKG